MPWTIKDVDRHAKGLTDKQKRAWVKIANSALERGATDGAAIRQANAAAKRIKEAVAYLESDGPTDAILQAVESILRRSESDDGVRVAVASALRAKYNADGGYSLYPWIRDIFRDTPDGDTVVYEVSGATWQAPFTLGVDDVGHTTAEVGDAVEVDVAYITMAEAAEGMRAGVVGELTELVEGAVRKDGSIRVKVIQPGWGSSGYYKADTLERDGPKAYPKGTKMYWDHPTKTEDRERPERSVRDLAAEFTEDATYDAHGPKGPGLYTYAKVFGPYREAVEELAEHIGVSIRGAGLWRQGEAEGRNGRIIEGLLPGKSADFVTMPGAGGEVLSLFESKRGWDEPAADPPAEPAQIDEGSKPDMTPEERAALLKEAADMAEARMGAQLTEVRNENARLREGMTVQEAGRLAAAILQPLALPAATKGRVAEAQAMLVPIKDGAIDREAFATQVREAAKAEARYLQSVGVGSLGTVSGMGGSDFLESDRDDDAADEKAAAGKAKVEEALTEAFTGLGLPASVAKVAAAGRS